MTRPHTGPALIANVSTHAASYEVFFATNAGSGDLGLVRPSRHGSGSSLRSTQLGVFLRHGFLSETGGLCSEESQAFVLGFGYFYKGGLVATFVGVVRHS